MQDRKISLILGWISLITPWLCVLGVLGFPPSISSLYYTTASFFLYGPLTASAVLLILYKGKSKFENILTTVAGFAALAICVFPGGSTAFSHTVIVPELTEAHMGILRLPANVSNVFHVISAGTFFSVLSFVTCVLCNDTGKKGKKRSMVYRICGLGSIAAVYLEQIPGLTTWIMELVAMTMLGIAWLTKANKYSWLYADKNTKNKPKIKKENK